MMVGPDIQVYSGGLALRPQAAPAQQQSMATDTLTALIAECQTLPVADMLKFPKYIVYQINDHEHMHIFDPCLLHCDVWSPILLDHCASLRHLPQLVSAGRINFRLWVCFGGSTTLPEIRQSRPELDTILLRRTFSCYGVE